MDEVRDGDGVERGAGVPDGAGHVVGGAGQAGPVVARVVQHGVQNGGERGAPVVGERAERPGRIAEARPSHTVQAGHLAAQLHTQGHLLGLCDRVVPRFARAGRHQQMTCRAVAADGHHPRGRYAGLGGATVELGLRKQQAALVAQPRGVRRDLEHIAAAVGEPQLLDGVVGAAAEGAQVHETVGRYLRALQDASGSFPGVHHRAPTPHLGQPAAYTSSM